MRIPKGMTIAFIRNGDWTAQRHRHSMQRPD
jgi:hypothetical protein